MEEEITPAQLVKSGKPVMGWFCTYLPEEILLAAGLLPYRITESSPHLSRARACLSSHFCSYVMCSLEAALEGKYNFLDGLIITNSCDAMRRLYDAWRSFVKGPSFIHLLDIPKKADEQSIKYFRQCLVWLKEAIETHYKIRITEQALKEAINITNQTRRLLNQLYQLRKEDNPAINGTEISSIMKLAMTQPKEEFNKKLSSLLLEIKNRRPEPGFSDNRRIRILITGGFIDQSGLVRLTEGLGACVVCEELCTGIRYFADLVDVNTDPLTSLSRRYLNRPSCARMIDADKRFDYLWNLIEEYRIEGVIYYTLKFCDTNLFEFPYLREKLRSKGMPVLFLDSDGSLSYLGQMRTRVEAFLDSLIIRKEKEVRI
jgi:bzd-type benzoyl-CoA reductase N subunit